MCIVAIGIGILIVTGTIIFGMGITDGIATQATKGVTESVLTTTTTTMAEQIMYRVIHLLLNNIYQNNFCSY